LRVIRSLLYVPAHSGRFIAKAHERGADAIILDLEDSVPPSEKDAARDNLAHAVTAVGRSDAHVFVRINAGKERRDDDAEAAAHAGAFGLLVPKVQSAESLRDLAVRLEPVERAMARAPLQFIALIEDPGAVLDSRAIVSQSPRLLGVVAGGEDLATAIGCDPSSDAIRFCMMEIHLAAKAAGILSFGLPHSIADYHDLDAVAASAREARAMGFDGASCIHPSVVPVLNAAFAPTEAELDHAKRLVAAFDAARAQSSGAFVFEGKMVDLPIYDRARKLLARARKT
jgi:citrate lyase subunit beta/citryl-CoA lyase